MCLGKSPICLHSSANGDQHRVKAKAQTGTLFHHENARFLDAFLCLSLMQSAASTCILWGDFSWEGNSGRMCEFLVWISFSQWQSGRFTTRLCKCCLWPLLVTQTTPVLTTPPSRNAVQKPVQSWPQERCVLYRKGKLRWIKKNSGEVGLLHTLLFCIKSDFKRDCKSLAFLQAG